MIRIRLLATVIAAVLAALAAGAAALAQQPQTLKVADNVYALIGTGDTVTRENRGRVANAGVIVGPTGVIVIDSGVSWRHGRQILEAVAAVTDRPVELVILTHAVREFVFGAAAFEQAETTIAAHRETRRLMKARCQHCLEQLVEQLGPEMEGTRLVLPRRLLSVPTRIRAGGIDVDLLHYGWTVTPGAVAIYHRNSGTLFAGGLVAAQHIPTIRDADFEGWQRALQQLADLAPRRVVPGYGPITGAESIGATAHYLQLLDTLVHGLYAADASLLEAIDQSELPAYSAWPGYRQNHQRNVLHRWLQLEIKDLGGDPRSTAMPADEAP